MEYGSVERELHVEASPEVVYEVISTPEHLREWWPDEADLEPVPGATGTVSFGDTKVVAVTVIEADPPRRFAFRWTHDENEVATAHNSLLVTFDLVPSGTGTTLRFSETGYREKGWQGAELKERYTDHASAWDRFLPRLGAYLTQLAATP
ncbi:SRPBCC domain-containing protein [Tenggerimyces flavus]|uniref:SRPBCC domain-containing protein n=1 Tax=Tenggerimyces flavus TaxID=1708749 RepID=A0ABV7YGB1_9ACTN|nr:SRPBCC domain-containing protein [Tenggerimyces flavus]MBM7784615.1 uncharacterized protein YndB with AHSA1/START domain [Tenggerimyces flavus]